MKNSNNTQKYLLKSRLLKQVAQACEDCSIDIYRLLAIAGFPTALLKFDDREIEHQDYAELLMHAASISGNSLFGMHVGKRLEVEKIGALGALLSHQQDLASCYPVMHYIADAEKHGATHSIEIVGQRAFHCINYLFKGNTRQMALAGLVGAHTVFSALLGDNWRPLCLHLKQQPQKDIEELAAFLGFKVKVDSTRDAIEIDKNDLYSQQRTSLIPQRKLKIELAQALNSIKDVVGLVRKFVQYGLPLHRFEKEDIAFTLGVHQRTLQNTLATHNTTYAEILREERIALSQHYLLQTSYSINEIAEQLGYSCAAAYVPQFKKWFGVTPLQWKKQQQHRSLEGPNLPPVN